MTSVPIESLLDAVRRDPTVARAITLVRERDARTLEDQIEVASIPAPSFHERLRGSWMAHRLREAGLQRVRIDPVGNVIAELEAEHTGGAPLVLAAHLDTVFDTETPIRIERDGDRLVGPGVCDDARGLAALITLARALGDAGFTPRRPVWLVATVGEEGAGDLHGVRHLFSSAGALAGGCRGFVSLDGAGVRRIVNAGPGARRWRFTMTGPGGHSWSDAGTPSPIHALAAGVATLSELPRTDPLIWNVGRWGGGTSVNAIAEEAWCEVEVRSTDERRLEDAETHVRRAMLQAANDCSDQGTGARLTLRAESIGRRPAGSTVPTAPIVEVACAATHAVGHAPALGSASTDANLPMSLGVPAITLGAGGEAGAAHTVHEWFRNVDGARGIERALLTLVALDRLDDAG